MAVSTTDIVKLYVALFDRAPAKSDVDYWYQQAVDNNWDDATLAQAMVDGAVAYVKANPDAASIYPQYANYDPTNPDSVKAVINDIYKILFNKDASTDPDGVNYWVDQITSGKMNLGTAVVTMEKAAEEYLNSDDAAAKAAAEAFENKVKVAEAAAENLQSPDVNGDGKVDFDLLQTVIKNVDNNPTTVTQALNVINNITSPNKVLTPKIDNVTGNKIFGSLTYYNVDGQGPTLNPGDTINGIEGLDDNTLYITDLTAGAANDNIPAGVMLNNIQKVVLNSSGNTAGGNGFSTVPYTSVKELDGITNGGGNDVFTASNQNTDVNVTHNGFTGNLTVVGGKDVTATTVGGNVIIGNSITGTVPLDTQVTTGNIKVNQQATGAASVNIFGGENVEVDVTSHSNTGSIDIGNTPTNTGNNPAGGLANPKGDVLINEAGAGNITVFGGKNVTINDTALKGAGTITVGDINYVTPSNLPSGDVKITETAVKAYDGLPGSDHNNIASGPINVYGGANVDITTNAANNINIGNLGAADETALNPTGDITIKNTGIVDGTGTVAAAAGTINLTGGNNVNIETTGASINIGVSANAGVINSDSNPTGDITVTETMNGAGVAHTINIDGGNNVTVNAKSQNVNIGTDANSQPKGDVTVNQDDIFTGNALTLANLAGATAGNVTIRGGNNVTVTTTGGNVTVGNANATTDADSPQGDITITNKFSGAGTDTISVNGGKNVNINTTYTTGAISVGTNGDTLTADGTALKQSYLAPTGDVSIVDKTGSTYGTGNVNVYTNGAQNVSITGGDADTIKDIQATILTGGANAGKAVGKSTLKTVTLDGIQSTDGVNITSDALSNLNLYNIDDTDTITITNNTDAHDLTISESNLTGNTLTVTDAKAGKVTITNPEDAKDSTETLKLQAAKATDLVIDNTNAINLNVGSVASDLANVTIKGSGNVNFASSDVFGAGNLSKALNIDASNATGDISLAITAKTDDTTQVYKGGKGVDTITITSNSSNWGKNVLIDGGDGDKDVLVANYAAQATDVALGNDSHIKGFEILRVGNSANGTYDASGFNTLQTDASGVAGNITFSNVANGVELDVLGDTTNARTITLNSANATGTNNSMTIQLNGITSGAGIGTGAITANEIENLTVDSKTSTNTATINGVATNGQETLTITGDQDLTLTSNSQFTKIDATQASGDIDVTNAAVSNSGVTFEGGAGKLTAQGSNDAATQTLLFTLTNPTATLKAGDTITIELSDGTNDITYKYTTQANDTVANAMKLLAQAIQTGSAPNNSVAIKANSGSAANLAGNITSVNVSGGDIVIKGNATANELEGYITNSTTHNANMQTSDSMLGGQQIDVITVTQSGDETGDTVSVDINNQSYSATAGATADATATNLANALKQANIAGIASVKAIGNTVQIISQVDKTNLINKASSADGSDSNSTSPKVVESHQPVNMTTVSDLVKSGEGGIDYTIGLGGSWNSILKAFGSGSETIDLTNSQNAVDTIRANDGAVATYNGATGGVTKFVVDSEDASDVLNFTKAKTILSNVDTAGVVGNVNGASTMANILDPSGNLASKLSNLTYTIKNGVITFGATGGHSLSEFTSGDLMSAAQILVSSSTTGGANKVAAFNYNGHTYVVASDANNTLGAGTGNKSTIIDFKDLGNVEGFGKTFGEGTIVSDSVTNLSNTAISTLQSSFTQDEAGKYAVATINAAGTASANSDITNINNLAAAAELKVTAQTNAHMGTINVTQVGANGHNSLAVELAAATTIDTLNVNGDKAVYLDGAANTSTITNLVDNTGDLTSIYVKDIDGDGKANINVTTINANNLQKIDATNATASFTLGDTSHYDAHNNLTIKLAGAATSTLYLAGANDSITQDTGTGAVTINSTGSNVSIDLSNGTNIINAYGANDTIKVGSGTNTIKATGSGDTIDVASGGNTSIYVGNNAKVTLGTDGVADTGTDTVYVGAAVTGGDSSNFSMTEINIAKDSHTAANDVVIDLNGTVTNNNAFTINGNLGQINVADATSLSQALDMAADYEKLTTNQTSLPNKLAANATYVDWFWYDGDTYIVEMRNPTGSAVTQDHLDDNDIVVKIDGLVDLSNAWNGTDAFVF